MRGRLRRALPAALKARDGPAVAALRSALAAIDNAEAVEAPEVRPARPPHDEAPGTTGPTTGGEPGRPGVAGAVVGLGAGEVARRELTEEEVEGIVRAEVEDRRAAAGGYRRAGQRERAERLLAEAEVLSTILDGRPPPAT